MVMEFFRGGADKELEQIEQTIQQMLVDCRHTFDVAINALLSGTDPALVKKDIKKTDRQVNKAEREVRLDREREHVGRLEHHGLALGPAVQGYGHHERN